MCEGFRTTVSFGFRPWDWAPTAGLRISLIMTPCIGYQGVRCCSAIARNSRWCVAALLLSLAWWSAAAGDATPSMLPRLTNAVQVQQLAPSEAERGYPASLRGVSTFYHNGENELVLQDGSGGVVIRVGNFGFELGVGQLLEVEGTTQRGLWAAELRATRLAFVGEAPLPPLYRLSETELAGGRPDCCWVEITGVVHAVEVGRADGLLGLEVATASNCVTALIKDYTLEECRGLVDSEVTIAGVLRRAQTGQPSLRVPWMGDITVTKPAPTDPFEAPFVPVGDILKSAQHSPALHRIKISGVVTFQQPGRAVFIQERTNSLMALTEQRTMLQPGDVIELAGFPVLNSPSMFRLEHAIVRKLRSGPPPLPIPITAEEGASGARGAVLVSIDGLLLRRERAPVPALYLQASNLVFSARLEDMARDFQDGIHEGSRLCLTAICLSLPGQTNSQARFELLLRSPADVSLATTTPASNTGSLVGVAVGAAAVLVLCTTILVLLRSRRAGR